MSLLWIIVLAVAVGVLSPLAVYVAIRRRASSDRAVTVLCRRFDAPLDGSVGDVVITFNHDGTAWSAMRSAEAFIRGKGWSIGPSDVTGIRGVICRPGVAVAKWKNLTPEQRDQCDGQLVGRGIETQRVLRMGGAR